MKTTLMLATLATVVVFAAGCSSSTDGVTKEDGLYCYDGFSYLEIQGQIVPSPETLYDSIDFECPQP